MNWKFAYAIGFHPWEDTDQEFFQSLASLLEREEQGREPPYGRALDVGTGSAIWGIELAKRAGRLPGWISWRGPWSGDASGSGTPVWR
jgi:hypothetical protein